MPHLRLIGLVLFITAVFLAMAAAVTHTTHIRFKRYEPKSNMAGSLDEVHAINPTQASAAPRSDELQFISVPVVYPLGVACVLGLMMWFVPAPHARPVQKRRRRR